MVSLRDALRQGDPIVATFMLLPRIEVVEMLARAGFGAVIIDMEHGPHSLDDVMHLAAAAKGAGIYSVARVREATGPEIGTVLDTGVDGVLVPHVGSAAAAARVVGAARFAPRGERSLNPSVRGTSYELTGPGRDETDARTAVMVMVEGRGAIDDLDAIMATPELDVVFVGPVDLSASLGMPSQPEHPDVVEAVKDLARRVSASGLAFGVFAPTPEAARRWIDADARFVALSADNAMVIEGFRSMIDRLRD